VCGRQHTSSSLFDGGGRVHDEREPVAASVLPEVQAVGGGVERAVGEIWDLRSSWARTGSRSSRSAPPTLGASWGSPSLVLAEGKEPDQPSRWRIDVDTASNQALPRRATAYGVVTQDSSAVVRIVGLIEMPDAWTGATLAVFSLSERSV